MNTQAVRPFRLGIVGLGKVTRDFHLPSIASNRSFVLAAGADLHARLPHIPCFASLEAMLDETPSLDAVAICTPPQVHYKGARLALEKGKHVLLEKPPCTNADHLQSLAQIARENGRTLHAPWHSQYARRVDAARRIVDARKLLRVEITWKEDMGRWHTGQEWLWQPGGFGVLDCGINALSILTRLVPWVFAKSGKLYVPASGASPVAAELEFTTQDGVPISAIFDSRHTGPEVWDIDIATDSGRLLLSSGGHVLTEGDETPEKPTDTLAYEYPLIYRHFAELIERRESDVDPRPLMVLTDLLLASRKIFGKIFTPPLDSVGTSVQQF